MRTNTKFVERLSLQIGNVKGEGRDPIFFPWGIPRY
jgi:hypothetical protein